MAVKKKTTIAAGKTTTKTKTSKAVNESKVEKKTVAPKATEEKAEIKTMKKEAPKKTKASVVAGKTEKKALKITTHIQYAGKDLTEDDLMKALKADWKARKYKASDIKSLELYVKPEDNKVYYVCNGDAEMTGDIDI
ncbi:MAG: DUF6465 family protein [Lachnospiraceae bacterium]|nr:DUF6465 family protein [Lachnospiraceae bacterium]